MKKVICSRKTLLPKKTLHILLVPTLVLGSLTPLSALAEEVPPVYSENLEEISNSNEALNGTSDIDLVGNEKVDTETVNTTNASYEVEQGSVKSPTAAADEYLDVSKVQESVNPQIEKSEKTPFWKDFEYLAVGGLLLLLGGGILLIGSLLSLKRKYKDLVSQNISLKDHLKDRSDKLEIAKTHRRKLEYENENLKKALEEQKSKAVEHTNIPDTSMEASGNILQSATLEDLNQSDLAELANSFENWIKTNRGSTKADDLIPEEILKKLRGFRYSIELWSQSDGVDSVKTTKSTKNAAIISVIKEDGGGYAYCYTKPNSLSSIWSNKVWYAVRKSNDTLDLLSELQGVN